MNPTPLPFDDSRRLTGINPWFDACGAVLEVADGVADAALVRNWRERVERMRGALDWPATSIATQVHPSGVTLAMAASADQLYAATEVNEWALLSALHEVSIQPVDALHAPGHPATWDESLATHTLRAFAKSERLPGFDALADETRQLQINLLIDEEAVTIGSGVGGTSWPATKLPEVAGIEWDGVHDIPIALVTGSNGKTTTVRLLAAILRAHGWRTGHSCTDGVFVDGALLESGDYSGPGGARAVLRSDDVQAAVLETARGGILRRGLAVQHAQVAIVTNVSDDHFGEYGVHDLAGLAQVKLTVARALGSAGLLVVNADDGMLVRYAAEHSGPVAWFAQDNGHSLLETHRECGGATCGVREGRLVLTIDGQTNDLGAIANMPLTFGGSAHYNVANIAAAALGAIGLGIAAPTIAGVLAVFGKAHADNPGRLQHWSREGVEVFVDYAHNPDGLRGLLGVATQRRGNGRLGLVLGQAGNREDAAIRDLAGAASEFTPDRVMLKDIEGYERGREAGEIARVLRAELVRRGMADDAVIDCLDEVEAARGLLAWARPGDLLVLPIHAPEARRLVVEILDGKAAV